MTPSAAFVLDPGAYTVVVGDNSAVAHTGTVLLEVYDVDETTASRLVNISSRGYAGPNGLNMIAGVIVRTSQAGKVLMRAIGPTLAASHITTFLHDPRWAFTTQPRRADSYE